MTEVYVAKLPSDESYWTLLMISQHWSGNGLVTKGNKLLPEPMLTQIYVAIGHHMAIMSEHTVHMYHFKFGPGAQCNIKTIFPGHAFFLFFMACMAEQGLSQWDFERRHDTILYHSTCHHWNFNSRYNNFIKNMSISKCHLQNVSHFVSASMI